MPNRFDLTGKRFGLRIAIRSASISACSIACYVRSAAFAAN
jgi:hypothetical protein